MQSGRNPLGSRMAHMNLSVIIMTEKAPSACVVASKLRVKQVLRWYLRSVSRVGYLSHGVEDLVDLRLTLRV